MEDEEKLVQARNIVLAASGAADVQVTPFNDVGALILR